MKVLVTGATGFVGSHIAHACLMAGDDVTALARPGSDTRFLSTLDGVGIVPGTLADADSLAAACAGVDVVHHSAALVGDVGRRAQFFDANVAGTARLLDAARRAGVGRFVFVSSPSAVTRYDRGDQFDLDESQPYPDRFPSPYAESKAAAERLVLAADAPDFTTCALRPRAVWGPRYASGWITKLLAALARGRLPDLSRGRTVLSSLTWSDHAAQASVLAARSTAVGGKAYFVADAVPTDVWAFIADLADAFGLARPTRTIPGPVLDALVAAVELAWTVPALAKRRPPPISRWTVSMLTVSTTYDTAAARRDLGYQPTVDQRTALERYVAWVESVGGLDALLTGGTPR